MIAQITHSHDDRPVEALVWNGQAAVAKRYREGAAGEVAEAMRRLWWSPFGVDRDPPGLPEPISLDNDTIVMEQVAGSPAAARRGDLGATIAISGEAAVLLADLHGSGVEVPRRRGAGSILRSLERKITEIDDTRTRRLLERAQVAIAERALDDELVVSHGDFSPRNLLVGERGVRLIDFDRCQMAARARDVTYWGAWAWATLAFAGERPTWSVGDEFEAGYADAAGRTAFPEDHRAAHRVAALVRIAHGWSALRDRPDIRRSIAEEALSLATA